MFCIKVNCKCAQKVVNDGDMFFLVFLVVSALSTDEQTSSEQPVRSSGRRAKKPGSKPAPKPQTADGHCTGGYCPKDAPL